jgi:hypothetical protein
MNISKAFAPKFPRFVVAPLVLALLGAGTAHAQQKLEGLYKPHKRRYDSNGKMYFRGPLRATLGVGAGYYAGDLTSSVGGNYIKPAFSAGALYRLSPRFVGIGEIGFVKLSARDQAPERNLAFVSNNVWLTGVIRYTLLTDGGAYASGVYKTPRLMPFVQAGLGSLIFSPSVSRYNGSAPSRSDGTNALAERFDYPSITAILPVGTGLTLRVNERINTTVEANYYFTNTDSLDDVKFRGNPKQNDGFGIGQLKLEYLL